MYRLALKEPCKCILQKSLQQRTCRHFSNRQNLPPNVLEAGFGKFLLILSPFAAVGGAVTYAKYDKDFRKTLEQNVPGAESFIKVALQEEVPFQGFRAQISNMGKSIETASATVTKFFGGNDEDKNQEITLPGTTKKIQKTATKEIEPAHPTPTPAGSGNAANPATLIHPPQSPPPPEDDEKLPSNILELEKTAEVAAALAVKEYNKAINILKNFNTEVRNIVEKAVENGEPSWWSTLRNKTSARDSSIDTAEKMARDAIHKIEQCEVALSQVANTNNEDQILAIRHKIRIFLDHINVVKDELYRNKDLATTSEKYWKNVEKARNYFIDEIESIFPGLNMSEKKLNLSKDDLDMFIMYAYSHVLAYQKELQRIQTDGELQLKRAIETFRGDNESDTVKAQLDYMLEAEKRRLAIDSQKKIFQIRIEAEKQLRQQLKAQAEAHIDHLSDAIALRESALKRNYSRELEEKIATEKANYKLQLASMLGKLRGMDAALEARAASERSAHQAQALWAACQSLWSTIKTGDPGTDWKKQLRPLRTELNAIAKVAEGDELVSTVLENLPIEAAERGVFPEDALRERFINVERAARKYALIREEGASIPMYFLSFLQSMLILKPDDPVSMEELENKKFDYSKLDTYDILNRARYYIDRGDMFQALKYMNLLQGTPRKVASDWLKEARLLLETQQAANTLMAHAAASGLLYL